MDATALATHLIGSETGLVCPLVPEPTAEHEILRENSNSTTENLSSQFNLQTIEVNNIAQYLKYTLTVSSITLFRSILGIVNQSLCICDHKIRLFEQ